MIESRKPLEPVHLSAGRLYLRPTQTADIQAVEVALRDPGIVRWNTGNLVAAAPEAARAGMWLRMRDHGWSTGTAATFAAVDATSGELLGTVGIRDIDRVPQQALAAYWTMPEARGQGVASQALDAVCRWAFTPAALGGLGLHRISLDHALENAGSCRVAEKAGFKLEGVMRDFFFSFDGKRYDSHLHARLSTDR